MKIRDPKKVADNLEKVHALLNDKGAHWIQGANRRPLGDGSYGFCLVGGVVALNKQAELRRYEALFALAETISPKKARENPSRATIIITSYNDKQGRKWTDIKKVLQKTIERLRA